jgi:2-polyprenyl-6-methoxyphenol hydroxylase-like FAD-dependent oxidoreductase
MFDVIVIGARCAGSSTAMLLGRRGHRVLLLDRASFPSDVISTHFLWPHGASYLNRWGLLDQVKAVTPSFTELKLVNEGIPLTGSVPLELLQQHFQTLHGDDRGLVQSYLSVRRRVLDDLLVDAAAAAGVEVCQGCAVERLLMEGDRVVGVVCRTKNGEQFEARAPLVVGADGRYFFLAICLNIHMLYTSIIWYFV